MILESVDSIKDQAKTKNDTTTIEKANNIYVELSKNNIDSIIDDTDENFSSKIKKMNLIGVPYQIIIG